MKNVEIEVYLISRSCPDLTQMTKWLKSKGVSQDGLKILDPHNKTDGEQIVELAGRRCYMSFEVGLNPNVTKIRTDLAEYLENILKSGHGSVLEHVTYTFAIENVSRVFTGEMNRHRAGWAISEGSMRYIRFTDIPYWVPTCIKYTPEDGNICIKKEKSRQVFTKAFIQMEENYKELCEIWSEELSPTSKFHDKKNITSMMRRIIGMGVASGGIWTGNLRAVRHVLELRGSSAAEEEIFLVATKMFEILVNQEPNFFKDFQQSEVGKYLVPKYHKV